MGIHGVDEDGWLQKSNQKELYSLITNADKVLSF
jgi:hypothetical protein